LLFLSAPFGGLCVICELEAIGTECVIDQIAAYDPEGLQRLLQNTLKLILLVERKMN
jgi:hypothetical protein